MAEYSQSRGNLNRCDGLFLLNEHGDLYFLLHKNIVHIILLNLEKKIKNLSEGKKVIAECVRKTVTPPAYLLCDQSPGHFLIRISSSRPHEGVFVLAVKTSDNGVVQIQIEVS